VVFRSDDVILKEQQKNLTDVIGSIHPWNHVKTANSNSGISNLGAFLNNENNKAIATCIVYRQVNNMIRKVTDILKGPRNFHTKSFNLLV
jgi:hypothetical protein